MFSNLLITRNGFLNFKGVQIDNQCVNKGNDIFRYELKVLFPNGTKLDQQGFVIDHKLFDETIQKASLNSCEIMSASILDAIQTLLKDHGLECMGCKLKIWPGYAVEENSAYFQEYRYNNDIDHLIVMNL
jgi:hypothetical protein